MYAEVTVIAGAFDLRRVKGPSSRATVILCCFTKCVTHLRFTHSRFFCRCGCRARNQGVHEQIDCEASNTTWAEDGSDRESKMGACPVLTFVGVNQHAVDRALFWC